MDILSAYSLFLLFCFTVLLCCPALLIYMIAGLFLFFSWLDEVMGKQDKKP